MHVYVYHAAVAAHHYMFSGQALKTYKHRFHTIFIEIIITHKSKILQSVTESD